MPRSDTSAVTVNGRNGRGQRRGPRGPAKKARKDPLKAQIERIAPEEPEAPLENAERHLVNFRRRFEAGSKDRTYFQVTRNIVVAARRWRKLANERIKKLGESMSRWEVLFLVAFSDDELTQGDLARLISVEGPSMVRMLDTLARDGLIVREQSGSDRRVTINRITPKGSRVIDKIMAITNGLRVELLDDIDPDDLAVCMNVLSKILRRLDEMRSPSE